MIIFLNIISLAAAGVLHPGDHHGDGHDEQCVDISRYLPVEYTESIQELCWDKLDTTCTKHSKEVCVPVPVTECEIVEYPECENIHSDHQVRDDSLLDEQFLQQLCVISNEKKIISETKKMPVCKTVSKQQCDSKWVVNEQGEKVWAGNDNCKEVSWEDCTLEDKIVTQEVDVWDCRPDTEPIVFQVAKIKTVDVRTTDRVCQPRANPVCSQSTEERCETVEWEDCYDSVTRHCNKFNLNVPHQEYDHRLRCSVSTRAISNVTTTTTTNVKSTTTAPIITTIQKENMTTTTAAPITTETTETQECEVEVPEEVCEEEEVCEVKESMQCETMMSCTEETGEVCMKKKICKKLWNGIENVIACEETTPVCEVISNVKCSDYPEEECKEMDKLECKQETVCTTETKVIKKLC